jgi:hypothetical protein
VSAVFAMNLSIELQHVIRADHMKTPWIPETRLVGQRSFVKLCKWDRGFVRFITSKGLNFADKSTFANAEFLDELCSLRNQKRDQELRRVTIEDADGNDAPDKKRQRRAYIRKARVSDDAILPATFEIEFPALPCKRFGEGSHTCLVLIDGIRTSTLFIELTLFNLEYIRAGILQSKAGRSRRMGRGEPAGHSRSFDNLPSEDGDDAK